ncbi:MAG: hypothetical protein GC161_03860 [Planctomycetaceae bacterium]|nr:hypothetical protein [Planctomycetaceae bacterium]
MPDTAHLETLVREQEFARQLEVEGRLFLQLIARLRQDAELGGAGLHKPHYFHLIQASNDLETYLDDHGARYNRTYRFFTELVAGLRGFAQAGYRLTHLRGRLDSYGAPQWRPETLAVETSQAIERALAFVQGGVAALAGALQAEATTVGLALPSSPLQDQRFLPPEARTRLPRNVGQDELVDEEQKIAEVASKFLQACQLLVDIDVRPISDPEARHTFLTALCTEEQARVYEAVVHNLQSTYDTYIKNTVLEARDARLPLLRGYASTVLHLLEAITELTHFHERHESEARATRSRDRMAEVVAREQVEKVVLCDLLVSARSLLEAGRVVAEDLLPSYLTVQEMEVELGDGLHVHARPAALIVGIVNHHGTPVEVQIGDRRCNAGSILELLVAVGGRPDVRLFRFRGDQHPLRDIAVLFESGLGEGGIDTLPDRLGYLRAR